MTQTIKNLPAMRETQLQYVGQEDPLEKEMATHSSILACSSLRTEEADRLRSPRDHKESDMIERLTLSLSLHRSIK